MHGVAKGFLVSVNVVYAPSAIIPIIVLILIDNPSSHAQNVFKKRRLTHSKPLNNITCQASSL